MSAPALVLVGAPGAGKSTVGRLLADRLGMQLRDTDAEVERVAGAAIPDVFIDFGEPHFRRLERAAVVAGLREHAGVLALGGGAVLDPDTRADLRGLPVVWLDVGLPDAARRVGLARDRPLLLGNPRAELLRLLNARRPLYADVATVRVDTDGRAPAQVADEVLAALRLPA